MIYLTGAMLQMLFVCSIKFLLESTDISYLAVCNLIFLIIGGMSTAMWGIIISKKRKMRTLKITCVSFPDGGWIPDRHSGCGDDISPELVLDGIDPATVSMAVTLDDADHPLIKNYNHYGRLCKRG